ncbi:radical SAM protein [bacterium]|nr:radical SAM protein [bacterium]
MILCDGSVFCVCGDFGMEKPLGNIYRNSITEIWKGTEFERLRAAFRKNKLPLDYCSHCIGAALIPKNAPLPQTADFPEVVHLETTVQCNLECSFCHRDVIESQRGSKILPPKIVFQLIDEIIAHRCSKFLLLVGYGEPFLDKNSYEYCKYLKQHFPEIIIGSSSNAIPFSHYENARKLVESGIDALVLSIDGVDDKTYLRYQVGGDLEKALQGMKNIIQARRETGSFAPNIIWQYLLFNWSDKQPMIDKAIALAKEYQVDILHFLPTFSPISGISWKYIFKPYWGMIYRFCGPEREYNPHNRALIVEMKQ